MAPLGNKSYREVTRLTVQVNYKIIFLPGALEMVFKETSLDPSVAVSSEKHVVMQTW